jgi:hypothetical protein
MLSLYSQVKRHLQLLRMLQLPAMLALLENGTRAPSGSKAKPVSGARWYMTCLGHSGV